MSIREAAPLSTRGGDNSAQAAGRLFFVSALNMSWQLAIVVLLPIIGGFKLDTLWHTTPILTIVGFVLAMAGMAAVVWRQLQSLSPKDNQRKSS